jgi:hypothetical protein
MKINLWNQGKNTKTSILNIKRNKFRKIRDRSLFMAGGGMFFVAKILLTQPLKKSKI